LRLFRAREAVGVPALQWRNREHRELDAKRGRRSDTYDWEGNAPLRRTFATTVIYEMHVAGFNAASKLGRRTRTARHVCRDDRKDSLPAGLGITAVELLSVFQFDRQDCPPGLVNYWGYSPVPFFAPHAGYSSRHDPLAPVDEFRGLVKDAASRGRRTRRTFPAGL
jgi:pullulanase/glycogen debranching enzyme